jgi:hypothetical protein
LYRRHRLPLGPIVLRARAHTIWRRTSGFFPRFGASIQRILEGILQDHDPDVIPVSPAASNPRPKATKSGLPPAAKVRALYQADSRIVKGSQQKSGAGGRKLDERRRSCPIPAIRLRISDLFRPRPPPLPPLRRPGPTAPKRRAAAPRGSARRDGWRSCSGGSTYHRYRPE